MLYKQLLHPSPLLMNQPSSGLDTLHKLNNLAFTSRPPAPYCTLLIVVA
jgi:hypothetical protein